MADAYRRIAPYYDRVIEPLNAGLRGLGRRMAEPEAGSTILDVGCGTGTHLAVYADTATELHGIDLSPAMLEVAAERLGRRAQLRLGDASQLPYPDDMFDLIITSSILHELDHTVAAAVVREIRRALRPEGRLLVIDFHAGHLSLKGRVVRAVTHGIERIAGRTHYRNFRDYVRRGGLAPLATAAGFDVESKRVVSGGNMSVTVLHQR